MNDYIGKYVKKFESGSKGSLALSSCGNDWGLSAGSYQLTLRWGNCINFLKKYFPNDAYALYFNNDMEDIATKEYPGEKYCSNPETVKSVWIRCYNKYGAEKFFEAEHDYIKSQYYDRLKEKCKDYIDLDSVNDRALQECFWSWSVHKGVNGSYKQLLSMMEENNLSSLQYIEKEELFDMIYDKRYQVNTFNRYKKGLFNGSSERECLRPLITKGTISGLTSPPIHLEDTDENTVEEPLFDIVPIHGTIRVINNNPNGVNLRDFPDYKVENVDVCYYNDRFNVIGKTKNGDFYQLENGLFITSNSKHVFFEDTSIMEMEPLYSVRVLEEGLEIKIGPYGHAPSNGTLKQNQIIPIVQEENSYGRMQFSGGWISLNEKNVKKLR